MLPRKVGDLLILRSGAIERGELKSYFGDRCQFGVSNISRDQIAWIGFSTAIATPPAISDPAHDEVHLRDGTVQTGRLVAVRLSQVVTEKKSYNRSQIAWIALAAGGESSPLPGEIRHPEIKDGGKPESGQPSASPPASPPGKESPVPSEAPSATRSPRPPNDAVKPCPADKPLGGHIEVKYVSNPYGGHDCQGTIRTVLRFPLVDNSPSTSPWSSRLWTGFSAPELNYDVSSAGCVDTPGDDLTCQAAGGRRTGKVTLGTIGRLGFSRGNVGYVIFKPVKPEIAFEVLPDEIHTAFTTPLTCEPFNRGGMKASWLVGFAGGTIRPRYRRGESDQAFVTFVDSTGCNDSNCMQHSELYAVIPFTGHSVWTDPRPNAGVLRVEMTWEICCGCGTGPREGTSPVPTPAPTVTPTPTVTPDPCGSTANQDSLWQHCLEEEKEIEKDIAKLTKDRDKEVEEARSHFDDFKLAANLCKLWDKTKELLEAIIGGPEFLAGLNPEQAAEFKEFQETVKLLTEMAEKAADGKNPVEAMRPEEVKDLAEKGEKLNKLIANINNFLGGYTPESGAKILEDCGAPIPPDLARSAEQYLEHLKASIEKLRELNHRLNDLRSKDLNDCQKKQWDAYKACIEYARCKGTPESACDDKKPSGNWPNVP